MGRMRFFFERLVVNIDSSMHGEMLRRMAEGDRDRRREKEVKEAEAKVRPSSWASWILLLLYSWSY